MNEPCHPTDHEWECNDGGYVETCTQCDESHDYDGTPPDDRDFSGHYEP